MICPIVLVRIDETEDIDIVRQLLRAHEYWRLKLLDVDLVIINEHGPTYAQHLHDSLETLVRTSHPIPDDHPGQGRVFILRGEQLSDEDRTLLQAAARAVLLSRRGSLADQVIRLERTEKIAVRPPAPVPKPPRSEVAEPRPELEFFNGLGGFADGGREYVTTLGPGQSTPAPWLNVIANPSFGFQVSESGSGYTWSGNSRENQLTPWSNDPVSDPVSEAIYVRDDDTAEVWGPTALPIRCEESTYVARHGAGYSRFEHLHRGIQLNLVQFVTPDDPVKVSVLTIENRSGRARRLSVTAYAEWALGTSRGASAPHIVTALDPETGALRDSQSLEPRVRRPGCVPRSRRSPDLVDRRPHRVPRSQWRTRAPGGPRPWAATAGSRRRRPRSVRGPADGVRTCQWGHDPSRGTARRSR